MSKIKRPLFIVIEGVDGSGKSTQIELLKSKLKEIDLKTISTHEPSEGPIGTLIRNIMKGRIQTDQSTVAALFTADRLDHINNPINGMKMRLKQGYNIICSRYYFSNYAFQSEYVPIEWLVEANKLSKSYLKPDIIFYLNIDPIKCSQRLTEGRVDIEMYENLEKIIKMHKAYIKHFKEYGEDENIYFINGDQEIEDVANELWKITKSHLSFK